MMCQELNTTVMECMFPNKPLTNPYVRMAIEKIVLEIGKTHDMKFEKKKMELIAKSGGMF